MARDEFQLDLDYAVDLEQCWEALSDVTQLACWVTMLSDVVVEEPLSAYRATLKDRIGPFALAAELQISVVDIDQPRGATIEGEGEDRYMGSRLRFSATLRLEPAPDGDSTRALIGGWYEVTGKVAGLGDAMIHRRAQAILREFSEGSTRVLT